MNRRIHAIVMAGVALAALVACSDDEGGSLADPSPPVTASSSAPSPALDPEVQQAVAAYESYVRARDSVLRNPVGKGETWPEGAEFKRWAYDPARSETIVFMYVLDSYDAEFRGDAAKSNVSVVEAKLNAKPYPLVRLADCQVPQGRFAPYNRETDKALDLVDDEHLDEPFLSNIALISVDGRWGVQEAEAKQGGSCEP
ncbi:hypothetical protein [Kineosporia babensis]|uniref:Lipoprotein n=1 Tax=Kineosporia babensis TaxID=499548 RepID=A0A9X1SY91_9ACTN|nr:hypothetical protein [Kineosporia babensis]MCD5316841.1 hypothetical protein [Kineosporia babensis]